VTTPTTTKLATATATATAELPDRLDPMTAQGVFRCLLGTLARPGRCLALLGPRIGPAVLPLALARSGSRFAVVGGEPWPERIRCATRATVVDVAEADLVAVYGSPEPELISRLRRGSPMVPEAGAKLGLACRRLHAGGSGGAVVVGLTGPGVDGSSSLGVDGVAADVFVALADANRGYPAGVDVWLFAEDGAVAAIPRSSTIKVC
jgi:alpha-D-ribose 1-methylphosphonate 5-triphosphate synthase subunit PhnH